jgi:hypothetical protein
MQDILDWLLSGDEVESPETWLKIPLEQAVAEFEVEIHRHERKI